MCRARELAGQNRLRLLTDIAIAQVLTRFSIAFARNFANDDKGYRTVKIAAAPARAAVSSKSRSAYCTARCADQREQGRGMRGMQPDAAMRRRSAEPRQLVSAVNGKYFRENQPRAIKQLRLPRRIHGCGIPCYALLPE
jgi:hypothetical protein